MKKQTNVTKSKSAATLTVTHGSDEKPLIVGDIQIPCYVLSNGQRVLSQSAMLRALGIQRGGGGSDTRDRLARFASQPRLEKFIPKQLKAGIENPIQFKLGGGKFDAYGYDAEILQGIVRGIAKAYLQGALQKQQLHAGQQAELLDDAFSKVGLIALIDEATGYQYVREQDELQKILAAYINKELLPWQKAFPMEFYQHIFRLNKWAYTPATIKKRPGVVGTWTNKLVYEQLPKGVLRELKNSTPKSETGNRVHRFHQLLTRDVGHPHLEKQLVAVITLMKISKTWKDFLDKFGQAFGQQSLELEWDNEQKLK